MSDNLDKEKTRGLAAFGLEMGSQKRRRFSDRGANFPVSDAQDFSRGARFVPGEVTLARRRGEAIAFVQNCTPCCWYWQLPDGSRIYHWDPLSYEMIGKANGRTLVEENGAKYYTDAQGKLWEDGAGCCPYCGNAHTRGGTVWQTKIEDF